MDYYKQLKDKILNKEAYDKIKDYSKERNTVITYYEIGEILHQAGKHYGEGIIQKYANSLEKDFGKKYNKRSLFRMRQFYLIFSEPKWATVRPESQKVVSPEDLSLKPLYNRDYLDRKVVSPSSQEQKVVSPENLSLNTLNNKDYSKQKVVSLDEIGSPCPLIITKLTWTHYRFILPIRDDNERYYYIKTAIINHLSVRELRDRIKSKEYYRLDEKTRSKLIKLEETSAIDYVKNPILIKNNNNYLEITEKILQTLILENLPSFLQELGNGFSFIANEYKIN